MGDGPLLRGFPARNSGGFTCHPAQSRLWYLIAFQRSGVTHSFWSAEACDGAAARKRQTYFIHWPSFWHRRGNCPPAVQQIFYLVCPKSLKSLIKGRHVEASPESGAGLRPFEESTKECVRPGEMSDKLLRWSLENVFSSSSCNGVIKKSRQDHCLRRGRTEKGVSLLEV